MAKWKEEVAACKILIYGMIFRIVSLNASEVEYMKEGTILMLSTQFKMLPLLVMQCTASWELLVPSKHFPGIVLWVAVERLNAI